MAFVISTYLTIGKTFYRITSRTFAMTSRNLERAMENLQKNPYYEKYAQRISEAQRTAPEEFLQRVERTRAAAAHPAPPDTRQFSSALNPKEPLERGAGDHLEEDLRLDAIFRMDLVVDKDGREVQSIWEEYHKNKEMISATIPLDVYTIIRDRMRTFQTFLFPLPRSQGYEFILSQCYRHTVHFTPLLAYQVHKENAPECLTVVHYTELADKGVVLMRGEYDKNVLSGQEAQCLANQFQMYYSGNDSIKLRLLQTFTDSPGSFKHMDLVSQLETIRLV